MRRVGLPCGGSTLTTSAPRPASSKPQYSPSSSATSTTRMPDSIPGFAWEFVRVGMKTLVRADLELRDEQVPRNCLEDGLDRAAKLQSAQVLIDQVADENRTFFELDHHHVVGQRRLHAIPVGMMKRDPGKQRSPAAGGEPLLLVAQANRAHGARWKVHVRASAAALRGQLAMSRMVPEGLQIRVGFGQWLGVAAWAVHVLGPWSVDGVNDRARTRRGGDVLGYLAALHLPRSQFAAQLPYRLHIERPSLHIDRKST